MRKVKADAKTDAKAQKTKAKAQDKAGKAKAADEAEESENTVHLPLNFANFENFDEESPIDLDEVGFNPP